MVWLVETRMSWDVCMLHQLIMVAFVKIKRSWWGADNNKIITCRNVMQPLFSDLSQHQNLNHDYRFHPRRIVSIAVRLMKTRTRKDPAAMLISLQTIKLFSSRFIFSSLSSIVRWLLVTSTLLTRPCFSSLMLVIEISA